MSMAVKDNYGDPRESSWVVNGRKSRLQPQQVFQWLGLSWDLRSFYCVVPPETQLKLKQELFLLRISLQISKGDNEGTRSYKMDSNNGLQRQTFDVCHKRRTSANEMMVVGLQVLSPEVVPDEPYGIPGRVFHCSEARGSS